MNDFFTNYHAKKRAANLHDFLKPSTSFFQKNNIQRQNTVHHAVVRRGTSRLYFQTLCLSNLTNLKNLMNFVVFLHL